MKILLKYPTRSRPDWFKSTFELYKDKLSGKHDVCWLITMDADDETMNSESMRAYLDRQANLSYRYGDHKTKIEACNADMDISGDWDVVVLVSDDMVPVRFGFDDVIAAEMQKHFPGLDGALNFPDGCCGDNGLITQSIMGRRLYERFGYIYWPEYRSFYCDTEFSDVVRQMGKCTECQPIIVKHEWKGDNIDALARHNKKSWAHDERLYKARKAAGWPGVEIAKD